MRHLRASYPLTRLSNSAASYTDFAWGDGSAALPAAAPPPALAPPFSLSASSFRSLVRAAVQAAGTQAGGQAAGWSGRVTKPAQHHTHAPRSFCLSSPGVSSRKDAFRMASDSLSISSPAFFSSATAPPASIVIASGFFYARRCVHGFSASLPTLFPPRLGRLGSVDKPGETKRNASSRFRKCPQTHQRTATQKYSAQWRVPGHWQRMEQQRIHAPSSRLSGRTLTRWQSWKRSSAAPLGLRHVTVSAGFDALLPVCLCRTLSLRPCCSATTFLPCRTCCAPPTRFV